MLRTLRRLYQSRVLIQTLVQRDLKARYRNTALGFLWSLMNPLLLMLVYSVVFSIYFRSNIPHYPVFLLSGLLAWNWHSSSIGDGSHALISNAGVIRRVQLPAELFPFVALLSNFVHFLLSLPVLVLLLLYNHMPITSAWLAFPCVALIQGTMLLGILLFTSAATVRLRDLTYIIPNLMMVWMFLSPMFYQIEAVPEAYRSFVRANPMFDILVSYQRIFYQGLWPDWAGLGYSAIIACALLVFGSWFFDAHRERILDNL